MIHIPFSRTVKQFFDDRDLRKQIKREKWLFNEIRFQMIWNETEDWAEHYLKFDVKGKTVLDVGAGAGESARFFLNNGAQKVICIEPNKEPYSYLLLNSNYHNIEPLQKYFELEDLELNFDIAKIDIEGYEEALLSLSPEYLKKLGKPLIVEIHSQLLAEKFRAFGFDVESPRDEHSLSIATRYGYFSGRSSSEAF